MQEEQEALPSAPIAEGETQEATGPDASPGPALREADSKESKKRFKLSKNDGPSKKGAEQVEPQDEVSKPEAEDPKDKPKRGGIRGLASWVERRAHGAISKVYQTQADDLEERARRVVGSAYREHSDDLEERAIRVLRSAIADEADRIKEAISHGVAVKKIEVRLSLIVLVIASLIYLGLFWFTQGGTNVHTP